MTSASKTTLDGRRSYHWSKSKGEMVPCASTPCKLHKSGDILAHSLDEAYMIRDSQKNGTASLGLGSPVDVDPDVAREDRRNAAVDTALAHLKTISRSSETLATLRAITTEAPDDSDVAWDRVIPGDELREYLGQGDYGSQQNQIIGEYPDEDDEAFEQDFEERTNFPGGFRDGDSWARIAPDGGDIFGLTDRDADDFTWDRRDEILEAAKDNDNLTPETLAGIERMAADAKENARAKTAKTSLKSAKASSVTHKPLPEGTLVAPATDDPSGGYEGGSLFVGGKYERYAHEEPTVVAKAMRADVKALSKAGRIPKGWKVSIRQQRGAWMSGFSVDVKVEKGKSPNPFRTVTVQDLHGHGPESMAARRVAARFQRDTGKSSFTDGEFDDYASRNHEFVLTDEARSAMDVIKGAVTQYGREEQNASVDYFNSRNMATISGLTTIGLGDWAESH